MDKFETVIEKYTVTITVDLPCSEQEYEEFSQDAFEFNILESEQITISTQLHGQDGNGILFSTFCGTATDATINILSDYLGGKN